MMSLNVKEITEMEEVDAVFSVRNRNGGTPFPFMKGLFYIVYGAPKIGKSLVALYVTKTAIEKKKNILYVDTEGKMDNMNPWLAPIKRKNKKNVFMAYCKRKEEFENFINDDFESIIKTHKIDVVVIDSLSAPYINGIAQQTRSLKLRTMCKKLKDKAKENNVLLLVTSHGYHDYNKKKGDTFTPYGGENIFFSVDYAIEIQNLRGWVRMMRFNRGEQLLFTISKDEYIKWDSGVEVIL